jgi:hypothetical protein
MNYLASRKFIVTLLSMASATFLSAWKTISAEAYAAVMIATAAAYITGNVLQKKNENGTTRHKEE